MSSIYLFYCSESEAVFQVVVEHSEVTEKKLRVLLQNWEKFVVKENIPREEAKALYEYLNSLKKNESAEDPDTLQQDQRDRKRVLEEIAVVKQDLKKDTEKIHAFADKVDKVHKDCTISKVVAHSTGAVSGVLSIAGLALAPLTMGAALPLCVAGFGLGVAATVTNVSTSIVEQVNTSSAETKTTQLLSRYRKIWKVIEGVLNERKVHINLASKLFIKFLKIIRNTYQFYQVITGSPDLTAQVKFFITNGKTFTRGSFQVPAGFGGMAATMAKGARIAGIVMSSVGLVIDVGFLVKESIHLHDGAQAESAEKLRQWAQELESTLEFVTEICENLARGLDFLNP